MPGPLRPFWSLVPGYWPRRLRRTLGLTNRHGRRAFALAHLLGVAVRPLLAKDKADCDPRCSRWPEKARQDSAAVSEERTNHGRTPFTRLVRFGRPNEHWQGF